MSLLDRPLPRWGKLLLRLPLVLYRLRLGRLLGHRFLVVVHRGRRTGTLYRTVVEVVRWNGASREAVVASGWGERSSWWRNVQAEPAVEVWLAGERFAPEQRVLDLDERVEALRDYQQEHPRATRILGPLLGLDGGEAAIAAAARRFPMVAFRAPARRPSRRYLSPAQARRVYDRIGRAQDLQALYERRPTEELLTRADFEHARAVFELGYGTGAFAERVLARLPPESRYAGTDVSPRMHELARRRLSRHLVRAELHLSDGSLHFPFEDAAFDRFVANYVLDLLAPDDIDLVLREARRLLAPGGLLCLVSLTPGAKGAAHLATRVWWALWSLRPEVVGGCRPIRLADRLEPGEWALRYHAVVTSFAISSEIVVAEKDAVVSVPGSGRRPGGR